MAKSWYLIEGASYNSISGFEGENVSQNSFIELLSSNIGYDIEILKYDLTLKKKTRAISENNTPDTELKTTRRNLLVPIGSAKAGDYVKYKNKYWLVTGLVDDNFVYSKLIISLCNYFLTWMKSNGSIVQRWVVVNSASQYNNGETNSQNFFNIRTDQLMIMSPCDEDCLTIDYGQRFIIDKRCSVYEKYITNETVKTDFSLDIYRLTRSDATVNDYQDGEGYLKFFVSQNEKRNTDGYYVVNGKGYWLCKDNDIQISQTTNNVEIIPSDDFIVYCGSGIKSTFTSIFTKSDGTIDNISPTWEIQSSFNEKIITNKSSNNISILVNDEKLANKSFNLTLSADSYEPVTKKIIIKSFI